VPKAIAGQPRHAIALAPLGYTPVQAHPCASFRRTPVGPTANRFVAQLRPALRAQLLRWLPVAASIWGIAILEQFRQWGSPHARGPPLKRGHTPGIEV